MGRVLGGSVFRAAVGEADRVDPAERVFPPAQDHGGDGEVHLVDQPVPRCPLLKEWASAGLFVDFSGAMVKGTTVRVNRGIAVSGAHHDLMLAFLDHWLGQRPVSDELRRTLLGVSPRGGL